MNWINDEERLIETTISFLKDFADEGYENAVECIDWLKLLKSINEKNEKDLPKSAYTSNKEVIEFADDYSTKIWKELMGNFQRIENYQIGCNDVSDIVLNAIINTYNKFFLNEQKDHDEKIIQRILLSLEKDLVATKNSGCDTKDLEDCINWLIEPTFKKNEYEHVHN